MKSEASERENEKKEKKKRGWNTRTGKDWERGRGWVRESVVAAINKSRERPVTLSASYNSK